MKFLVVGLGSMGKRRIRCLLAHGEKEILGLDLSQERCAEAQEKYGVRTTSDVATCTAEAYDAMLISTPPNLHALYIRKALSEGKSFFVEPATSDEGYEEIFQTPDQGTVRAPSCTLRYFAPIKKMKELLEARRIGSVLAYQYHMGQYLPDWHPWEDYRKVYFGKKETGACREMFPFEQTWLSWLVGSRVKEVGGYVKHVSALDMPADDLMMATLQHENGVFGQVMIDVISRKPFRSLRILGSDGVIEWDWLDPRIRLYDAGTKETEIIDIKLGNTEAGYITVEDMYIEEVGTFLDALYGRRTYPYSFREDLVNLRALFALERSSMEGSMQRV